MQEQELINFVLEHIRKRGTAQGLVKELEMVCLTPLTPPPFPHTNIIQALDEDAETMVKKVWRMVIFYSESEKRGLN